MAGEHDYTPDGIFRDVHPEQETPPEEGADIAPPLKDGRYRLTAPLGVGGMAVVFLGFDTQLHVYKAIKILKPEFARSQPMQARFLSEARTMARLRHRHIVEVHDVGHDSSKPFIVMEFLEGGTLHDTLTRGPFPPYSACKAIQKVLQALHVAHGQGVIHRDIKPQNVLLDLDGVPKLSDFGIATATMKVRGLTRTGMGMGTPAFMSPEQFSDAKNVDNRTDLYAVGASLYHLLTAVEPFHLDNPVKKRELLEGLPDELAAFVGKSCSFHKEERFATARDMALALRVVMESLPVPDEKWVLATPLRGDELASRIDPDEASFILSRDGTFELAHTTDVLLGTADAASYNTISPDEEKPESESADNALDKATNSRLMPFLVTTGLLSSAVALFFVVAWLGGLFDSPNTSFEVASPEAPSAQDEQVAN
ncbi:MAG: serine/threonine protein kinase, partial [Proteobacteria bacterium]|nr:serine/threonine protein kinase [Pseudomonadota bacterium]